MKNDDINQLMTNVLLGKASEEDIAELKRHADSSVIKEIIDSDDLTERYEYYAEADVEDALSDMKKKMAHSSSRSSVLTPSFSRIAAVIALLLVGGAFLYYSDYTKVTPPEIADEVIEAMQQSIQSGKQEALDTRVNTEELVWSPSEGSNYEQMTNDGKGMISGKPVIADMRESLTKKQVLTAHRITTKHDKEFWLTLDDGTLVHLNNNTRVIYPEKFGRGDRNVILEGEAYFMVAKDKSRPFIVHTPDGDVKVYGTEFNVNTREDVNAKGEGNTGTTVVLVKGSVSVTPTGGKEQLMTPGKQCRISNRQCLIEDVDVEPYVAWNEGIFYFDNCTLEHLMRILSHWYGMNINFVSDETRSIKFTGNVNKYSSIEPAIHAIHHVTGLQIEIKGNTITIDKE